MMMQCRRCGAQTHKEEVGVGRLAANLEQLNEVVELTVHVAAHGHRALDGLHIALLDQDLPRLRRDTSQHSTKAANQS